MNKAIIIKAKSAICDREKRWKEKRSRRHAADGVIKEGNEVATIYGKRADGKIGRKPSGDNNICRARF